MSIKKKVSDFINKEAGSNAEPIQNPDENPDYTQGHINNGYEANNGQAMPHLYSTEGERNTNITNFPSSRTPVMLKRVTTFSETQEVADALNEKRIVILNLESCKKEDAVRVIDFLSGVAYANGGGIEPIAGRAYIITPERVPLTGDFNVRVSTADDESKFSGR